MRITPARRVLAALALLLAARGASAQQVAGPLGPADLPACAELGLARVAITVPPGRTVEDLQASIQRGEIVQPGVEALILPTGRLPNLVNQAELRSRVTSTLRQILERLKVDGAVSVLLEIDAEGVVRATTPSSGNRELDRGLDRLWREARFSPMAFGGCRVPAWVHLPLHFTSDHSLARREIQMHIGEPPRPGAAR